MANKIGAAVAAALLCCASRGFAAEKTVTGVLVDRVCYVKAKADPAHAGQSASDMCLQSCAKENGARIALITDEAEIYTVIGDLTNGNNAKLAPHLCHRLTLTGDVTGDGKNVLLRIRATELKMVSRTEAPPHPRQLTLPGPYRLEEGWPTLPSRMNGGRWGELIRVNLDPRGNIWVFHRCFSTQPEGAATCVGHPEPPILQFDPAGTLLTSFGGGMFAFPHGFTVDDENNIWACDLNAAETAMGLSAKATDGPFKGQPRGMQCFKFSPSGKVLMTLGKAGVRGNGPDTFSGPQAIGVAANGDIFVVDDGNGTSRIMKFSKDGTFLKSWGRHNARPCAATLPSGVSVDDCKGAEPGEFDQPHDMAFDSSGRVFIADRGNNRIQIFDQEGNFIAAWSQFGRPSAIYISKDDTLYASDSHSNKFLNPGYTRGITVGSAKDGSLKYFIPDPDLDMADGTRISGASGIAADTGGTVYAADVGSHNLRKYVKAGQ